MKKINWRVLISFVLTFTFLIILFTGIILYIKPPGRIANWTGWTLFGLDKHQWQAMHTVFSFTFAFFSILHLFWINWKCFWAYIKCKSKSGFNKLTELIIALAITILIALGTYYYAPPLSYILDWGDSLSESWGDDLVYEEDIILEDNEIDESETDHSLNTNHDEHNLEHLKEHQREGQGSGQGLGSGKGRGLGRKTLKDMANEVNVNINDAIENLERAGYFGEANETIKSIAENNNCTPKQISDIVSATK